jgi:Calcium binding
MRRGLTEWANDVYQRATEDLQKLTNLAVPLSQLTAIDPDQSTREAIEDWHYWVAQGYCF